MGATTVDGYLAALPEDRRAALGAIRDVINANLPEGYEEGLQYGIISWYVPLSRYADTYNKQALMLAGLASMKNYMTMHLPTVYGSPSTREWFEKAYARAGKKLDMGKGCVRFTSLDGVPLDVIGELVSKVSVDSYVEHAERAKLDRKTTTRSKGAARAAKKKTAAKVAAKKVAAKKPVNKAVNKAVKAKKPVAAKKTATRKARR